jgi:hypothetical protein
MAKKNTGTTSTDQPAAPRTPRRRAPAKKAEPAAPPVDIAGVSATEPLATAPDTGAEEPAAGPGSPTHDEIAEAAYYRHLNRGGRQGGELDDWIEAERELRERRRR